MGRDLTTSATGRRKGGEAGTPAARRIGGISLRGAARLLAAMLLGALLLALAYQVPVIHTVDIGGYDAAYVQGFYDPERAETPGEHPFLAGSDGSARWTRAVSDLLFPQAGLPARVTLRLRGRGGPEPAPEAIVLLNGAHELGRIRPGNDWQEYSFTISDGMLKPEDVVIEIRTPAAPLSPEDPRPAGLLLDRATYQAGPAPILPYPAQLLYAALAGGMLYLLTKNKEPPRGYPTKNKSPEPRTTQRVPDQDPRTEDGRSRIEDGSARSSILYPLSSIFSSRSVVGGRWSVVGLGLLVLSLAFLALYRAQPPYPYPLRGLLPAVNGLLAALLALRYGPAVVRRIPILLDGVALGGIAAWTVAVLRTAQAHVTLAVPGVENDFRVFALRSAHLAGSFPAGTTNPDLDGVFRADGFYNLGYPLLLWLVRPLTAGNPFLAARLVAALSGALLLGATWWLARRLFGRGPALLALLALAFSPMVVEYALYLGTDMPFAALCTLALALLASTTFPNDKVTRRHGDKVTESGDPITVSPLHRVTASVLLAGLIAGAAFLVRHPGILLLPLGWLALYLEEQRTKNREQRTENQLSDSGASRNMFHVSRFTFHALRSPITLFTLAFLIAILPQVAVNLAQTGQPLYSQQAKNIWLAVFAGGDWSWSGEISNDVSLAQVILWDPGRFLASWWGNLRAYFGTGGEDTSEFGRAIQLRLLGFPANWLALAGLLGWLALLLRDKVTRRQGDEVTSSAGSVTLSPLHRVTVSMLLAWIALYVLGVSVGLALPRFFLPLAPVYALAAAWTITRLEPRTENRELAEDGGWRMEDGNLDASEKRSSILHPRSSGSRFTFHASRNRQLIAALLLLILLWGGFATGAGYVTRGQPEDEVAMARIIQATLQPGERLIARVPPRIPLGKYSAIAHLVVPAPGDDPAALRASGARYLLWSSEVGPAPAVGERIDGAGPYTLYRISP